MSTQPHITDDDEGDDNPCIEDEELFQGGPADDMEEAISALLHLHSIQKLGYCK